MKGLLDARRRHAASQRVAGKWRILVVLAVVALGAAGACSESTVEIPTPVASEETSDSRVITKVATAAVTILTAESAPTRQVTEVRPSIDEIEIAGGRSIGLSAQVFDQDEQPLPSAELKWAMIDLRAGHVDGRGVFTAGDNPGLYTEAIQVTASQQTQSGSIYQTAFITVTVTERQVSPSLDHIEVFPQPVRVRSGAIVQLQALGFDVEGEVIPTTRLRWSLQSPVGRLSQRGFLRVDSPTGVFPGAIEVEGVAGERRVSIAVDLEVIESEVVEGIATIHAFPQKTQIAPGESFQFRALVLGPDGRPIPNPSVIWRVSDPAIGEITPDGIFHAGAIEGTFSEVVVVELEEQGQDQVGRSVDFASVEIRTPEPPPSLESIEVSPKAIIVFPGQKAAVQYVGRSADGYLVGGGSAIWFMADSSVGEVDQAGTFSAGASPGRYEGAVCVSVRSDDIAKLTVRRACADVYIVGELETIEIKPLEAVVPIGGEVLFTAQGFDEFGTVIPGLTFRWRLTEPVAGRIDQTGVFIAEGVPGSYVDVIEVSVIQTLSGPG